MLKDLVRLLEGMGRFAVAFSGGVDSSLLCAVAARAAGNGFVAVTADTPFTHRTDLNRAQALATRLGFGHRLVSIDPTADPSITSNTTDRCYLCKKLIMGRLSSEAARLGLNILLDGTNADDVKEARPGLRALRELGVGSPLAEMGMDRAAVVSMSVELGMPDPHRLNAACLATRIPRGVAITPDLLRLVEGLEGRVLATGLSFARVRTDGVGATVELLRGEAENPPPGLESTLERIVAEAGLHFSGIRCYENRGGVTEA